MVETSASAYRPRTLPTGILLIFPLVPDSSEGGLKRIIPTNNDSPVALLSSVCELCHVPVHPFLFALFTTNDRRSSSDRFEAETLTPRNRRSREMHS